MRVALIWKKVFKLAADGWAVLAKQSKLTNYITKKFVLMVAEDCIVNLLVASGLQANGDGNGVQLAADP